MAREAIDRRLSMTGLSEVDRGEALVAALNIVLSGTPTDEDVKMAVNYVKQTDSLSAERLKHRIAAHQRLAGYYSYSDIDAPNLEEHTLLIKLIDQLPEAERKAYAPLRQDSYDHIALVQANRGDTAKALATLQQARSETSEPRAMQMFDDSTSRYQLVGQRVPPIKGSAWLNASPETRQFDPTGHVTLVQFTAHWCGPCRKSYPAMLKFHERFGARGLEVMLATELYGYFENRENLKPEDEIAADRDYFLGKYKLPFKVAIEQRMNFSDRTPAGESARKEFNQSKYRVGGIPQIMLIDRQGIVRHILVGWDPANEEMVMREIDRLLKEPAAAASK